MLATGAKPIEGVKQAEDKQQLWKDGDPQNGIQNVFDPTLQGKSAVDPPKPSTNDAECDLKTG
jgi:hypothetical protein